MNAAPSRAVLRWGLLVPFYGMPVVLTLYAWDLYGGFALHLRFLIGLALLGAAFGWARSRVVDGQDVSTRVGRLLPAIPGPVLLSQVLALAVYPAADALARLTAGLGSEGHGPDLLGRLAFAATVAVAVASARDEDGHRRAGGIVAVGWLVLLAARTWELSAPSAGIPYQAHALVLLAIAAATPFLPTGRAVRLGSRIAIATAWAALIGLVLARIGLLVGLGGPPSQMRPLLLGSFALAAVPGIAIATLRPRLLPWLRRQEGQVAERASAVAVALVVAALCAVAFNLAALTADRTAVALGVVEASLQPLSDPGSLSPAGRLAILVLWVRAGLRAGEERGVLNFVGAVGVSWALLVLAAVGGIAEPPGPTFEALGSMVLLLLAAGVFHEPTWRSRALDLARATGWVLAPFLFGRVLGRALAAALPMLGEPSMIAALVSVLAAVAGALAFAVLRRRTEAAPLGLLARRVGLTVLSAAVFIYLGVFFAIAPLAFAGTVLLLTALAGLPRLPPLAGRVPPLGFLPAVWLLFYVSFFSVVAFKEGPGAEACAAVSARTDAIPLLLRFEEGGDYPSADPYDLLPSADGSALVVTFKRFDHQGGWIEVLSLDDPTKRTRLHTRRPDGGPFWPERFVRDPTTDRYYFGMLGIDAYALWETELQDDPAGGAPTMEVLRTAPMAWEPSYPDVDPERRRLVQSYLTAGVETAPNRGFEQPLVEVIDLDKLTSTGRWSIGPETSEMSEYVEVDPRTGRYYVPAYFNLVRFALIELDGDALQPRRRIETFHPTIGLDVDPVTNRLFVTNCLGGTLDVYDLDTFERTASVPSGAFPRDLVLDARTGRVYVGNYSSGDVAVFETRDGGQAVTPRRTRRVEVGPVLRGIGLHEGSGRVFAASACGVYEVPTEASGG